MGWLKVTAGVGWGEGDGLVMAPVAAHLICRSNKEGVEAPGKLRNARALTPPDFLPTGDRRLTRRQERMQNAPGPCRDGVIYWGLARMHTPTREARVEKETR